MAGRGTDIVLRGHEQQILKMRDDSRCPTGKRRSSACAANGRSATMR
jgi:hypothetical protein